jgi:uncharacterized NAD-dependent epimerase/dehydratase family protein
MHEAALWMTMVINGRISLHQRHPNSMNSSYSSSSSSSSNELHLQHDSSRSSVHAKQQQVIKRPPQQCKLEAVISTSASCSKE